MYKILVLGNGFDLACGLPTRYTDFLNFLRFIDPKKDESEDIAISEEIERIYKKELDDANSEIKTYQYTILTNVWVQHFLCIEKSLPQDRKWMDFEAEMSRVIRALEKTREYEFEEDPMSNDNDCIKGYPQRLDNYPWIYLFADDDGRFLLKTRIYDIYRNNRNEKLNELLNATHKNKPFENLGPLEGKRLASYNKIRKDLLDDLKGLIGLLDYYLRVYVSKLKITNTDIAPEIIKALNWFKDGPDSTERILLTFNYTDTFTTLMEACGYEIPKNLKICHIHGEIGKGNIVLGIDDNEQSNDIFWGQFEKYYQKIHNKVDGSFYHFANSSDYLQAEHEVKFIGHSFAVTDKHPLKKLLTMRHTKTEVFYIDDDAESNIIRNITAIIGKDVILEQALGNSETLRFTKITTKKELAK